MDEIIIEEKKYISSKRAAKITGYAKDYIGQLCREGRVPARLVGRNWYVLETAIQDHRFGNPEQEVEQKEPLKYEEPIKIVQPDTRGIQESWQSWFDRFDPVEVENEAKPDHSAKSEYKTELVESEPEPELVPESEPEPKEKIEPEQAPEPEEESDAVDIPIHVHTEPRESQHIMIPTELMPRRSEVKLESEEYKEPVHSKGKERKERRPSRAIVSVIQTCGILLAIITFATAVLGSGYFDKYAISNNQVRMIAGIILYNKQLK